MLAIIENIKYCFKREVNLLKSNFPYDFKHISILNFVKNDCYLDKNYIFA